MIEERSESTPKDLRLSALPVTVERRLTQVFRKDQLISMHGVTLRSQGSQCVFNLQEDFLFVSFDIRMMES